MRKNSQKKIITFWRGEGAWGGNMISISLNQDGLGRARPVRVQNSGRYAGYLQCIYVYQSTGKAESTKVNLILNIYIGEKNLLISGNN